MLSPPFEARHIWRVHNVQETFIKDLKQAFRLVRRSPGFAATAIAALALGIGANTAIFSVVDTVLLKPLPYPESARIVQLMNTSPQGSFPAASVPKYNLWRAQTQVLQDVAAYNLGGPGVNISGGDRPEQVKGIHVSCEFFLAFRSRSAALSTRMKIGRAVRTSWSFQTGYGIVASGATRTLRESRSCWAASHTQSWAWSRHRSGSRARPISSSRSRPIRTVINRRTFFVPPGLKPGVTVESASAALKLAAEELRRKFPNALGPKQSFAVTPVQDLMVSNVKTALYILLGAVGFVLLIACANVANLQLARASVRAREIAIRTAIGAGRGRIIRQLLTESMVLSVIGAVVGLALGFIGVRALLAANPGNIPRIGAAGEGITLDWTRARVYLWPFCRHRCSLWSHSCGSSVVDGSQ